MGSPSGTQTQAVGTRQLAQLPGKGTCLKHKNTDHEVTRVFFISNQVFSQPQIDYFFPFLSLKNFLNFPMAEPQVS